MSKVLLRISQIGHCPRQQSALILKKKLNIKERPFPAGLREAAQDGKDLEHIIKARIKREENLIIEEAFICPICKERFGENREGIHVELDLGNVLALGHMDGRCWYADKPKDIMILEIKTMSQGEYQRWMSGRFLEFPQYADQLTAYQVADNHPNSYYYVKNRNIGSFDKNLIRGPVSEINEISERANYIAECVNAGKLCEREYLPETVECQRCPVDSLCIPTNTIETPKQLERLTELTNKYRAVLKSRKLAENDIAVIKEELMSHMIATKKTKFKINDFTISYNPSVSRTTYSKDRLLSVEGITEVQLAQAANISTYPDLRLYDLKEES